MVTLESKMFPVMSGEHKGFVDIATAEKAYEVYSFLYGSEQSLERIGQRGGFYFEELASYLGGEGYKRAKLRGFRFKVY